MATLVSPIELTGSLAGLSFYKRWDLDKIIVRRKGGASKQKVKEANSMAGTRRVNDEFGGRATASKFILAGLNQLKPMADYNIAGGLNQLLRPVQLMDQISSLGTRSVCLSKAPGLLEGFSLNRKNSFDSIIRNPLTYSLSRNEANATITIPALIPGINFFVPPGRYPLYSFIVAACVVPDLYYSDNGYQPANPSQRFDAQYVYSGWHPVSGASSQLTLETTIGLPANLPLPADATLMLSIGIRFGMPGANGSIEQVKYAGAAKVVAVR